MDIDVELENLTFINGVKYYTCTISEQVIPENTELNLIRVHDFEYFPDSHVSAVIIRDCEVTKVPQGLMKIFPNLKILHIVRSKLKVVTKHDLVEYRQLENLGFMQNSIEFFPADLFEGFENLKIIRMNGNGIKVLEPNILDALDKLEVVDFRDGMKYTNCFSIHQFHRGFGDLDDVKNEIFVRYYKDYKNVENFFKFGDGLTYEELKSSNEILTQRLKRQKHEIQDLKQKLDRCEKVQKIFSIQKKLDDNKIITKESESSNKMPIKVVTDIANFLYGDETFKDLKIEIESHKFSVHKIVVAARSPTLAELLKANPEASNLKLVDISVETFEKILKFLYTEELPGDDGTNFLHLFAAAGKLKIDELREYAGTKLVNMINKENAVEVFKLSSTYGGFSLRQKSYEIIKNIYSEISFEDKWFKDPEFVLGVVQAYHAREDAIKKANEDFDKFIEYGRTKM